MKPPPKGCVYRFRDGEGVLLYVGSTGNFPRRLHQHETTKGWWADVARIDVEHLPNREAAFIREEIVIRDERPLWNVLLNGPRYVAPEERSNTQMVPTIEAAAELCQIRDAFIGELLFGKPSETERERLHADVRAAVGMLRSLRGRVGVE